MVSASVFSFSLGPVLLMLSASGQKRPVQTWLDRAVQEHSKETVLQLVCYISVSWKIVPEWLSLYLGASSIQSDITRGKVLWPPVHVSGLRELILPEGRMKI